MMHKNPIPEAAIVEGNQGLKRAVEAAGGTYSALARKLAHHTRAPITVQAVYKWSVKGVPAERAVQIEKALHGAVTRQELRPDLYERV